MLRKICGVTCLFLCILSGISWGEQKHKGVVLALSGGGTKGLAHIGVLRVFEEAKIPLRGIVGTSMGAIMGGLYAAGYSSAELAHIMTEEINIGALVGEKTVVLPRGRSRHMGKVIYSLNFDKDGRLVGPLGLMPGRELYSAMIKFSSKVTTTDFNELPVPYAAVATDLVTGKPVILREGNLADVMRASMSLPGIFDPWNIGGRLLVDGGIVANVPVRIAKELFPGYPVVAVMVTSEMKDQSQIRNPMDVLSQVTNILTGQNVAQDLKEADLIIRPQVGELPLLGTGNEEEIIHMGALGAEAKLPELKELTRVFEFDPQPIQGTPPAPPLVSNVRIVGFSPIVERFLRRELSSWLNKPLDTRDILHTCKTIENRDDVGMVGYRLKPRKPGEVEVVVECLPMASQELLFSGYTSNFTPHRWVGVTGIRRGLFAQGDTLEVETQIGKDWQINARYFSPAFAYERNEFMLQARKWHVRSATEGELEWERYAAGIYGSKWEGNLQIRYGVVGERLSGLDDQLQDFWWGPFLSFQYGTLDDPQHPTRGMQGFARFWWVNTEKMLWEARGAWYKPLDNAMVLSLQGGALGGDAEVPPHGAWLGGNGILYHHNDALLGENMLWAKVSLQKPVWKNGIFPVFGEVFFTQGFLFDDSWERQESDWELGVAASVPGSFLGSKLFVVYDEEGEVTVGFEIGGPFEKFLPIPE